MYIFIFIFSAWSGQSPALASELDQFFKGKWKLNKSSLEYLRAGKILAETEVSSSGKEQSFSMKAAGWHNKKCSLVLRKLSRLEMYQDWISFVKSSEYDEKRNLFTVKADHTLLPYPMIVHIIMQRPSKPGVYKFTFPTGIFAGLVGRYTVEEKENRCLLYATSSWKGPKTNIPDLIVELFVEGLTKKAAELLIRKTQF